MKPALAAIALLLCAILSAQAPEPARLPGEPHHHLKIDNEYVRAYYVEVPPHEDTQLHQHDHDYIFLTLGDTEVINAVLGKPEVKLSLRDGEVRFTRGGFAHVARNLGDKPFRNVTIEFLKPQGEVHNLCERVVQGDLGTCQLVQNPSMSGKPYFESEELLGFVGTLNPRVRYGDTARFGRLLVALDQAELEVSSPGLPATKLHSGGMLWLRANGMFTIANLGAEPSRYLTIFFKDSGTAK